MGECSKLRVVCCDFRWRQQNHHICGYELKVHRNPRIYSGDSVRTKPGKSGEKEGQRVTLIEAER